MKYARIESELLNAKGEICGGLAAHVTIPLWRWVTKNDIQEWKQEHY